MSRATHQNASSTSRHTRRRGMPGDHAKLRRIGEPRVGGAGLYIAEAVLDELVYAALYSPESIQTALLLGGVFRGSAGLYVEVRGYAELGGYDDLLGFIRESNAAWGMTMNRLSRNNADLRVVGWVGLLPQAQSLAETDVQLVHRSLFNLPYQVALLMDPVHRTCAAYGADKDGALACVGFNVVERGTVASEQAEAEPPAGSPETAAASDALTDHADGDPTGEQAP